MTAHVNIGSNLGDSRATVCRAADAVSALLGTEVRRAPVEESEPWGFVSAHRFVNLGIAFDTCLEPLDLLHRLQEVEMNISAAPHRNADGTYSDRIIDIDLIALGDTVTDLPELTLPHPRMHLRPFVLRPVAALDPAWRHPRLGLTAAELLARIAE